MRLRQCHHYNNKSASRPTQQQADTSQSNLLLSKGVLQVRLDTIQCLPIDLRKTHSQHTLAEQQVCPVQGEVRDERCMAKAADHGDG